MTDPDSCFLSSLSRIRGIRQELLTVRGEFSFATTSLNVGHHRLKLTTLILQPRLTNNGLRLRIDDHNSRMSARLPILDAAAQFFITSKMHQPFDMTINLFQLQRGARALLGDLSWMRFITGDDHCTEQDLDIDDIFAKPFDRIVREALDHNPASLEPVAGSPVTASQSAPGYAFLEVNCGLLLVAPDGRPAGGYISCDLSIAPEHRGRGLGAEIVLEYFLRNGQLPTWFLDTPAYSIAGLATHRAAWEMPMRNPDMVVCKSALLNESLFEHDIPGTEYATFDVPDPPRG